LCLGGGAALAWVVWRGLPARQRERRLAGRADRTAVALALAAGLVGVSLLGLRYATWHTHVFDLGSYDQKIWVASVQEDLTGVIEQTYRGGERFSPCGATRYWGICHFQPIYVIYALAYRLWPSPLLLLWSQALLVASGVIPCYLLTRKLLGSTAGVLGVMVYLLHPAVQFNALLDFRPDHVAIPFVFWVLAGPGNSEGAFMIRRYVSVGSELVAPGLVAGKLVYLVSLFGPVAFLSWRDPVALLPAMPSLGISLLSNDVAHSSIESQY